MKRFTSISMLAAVVLSSVPGFAQTPESPTFTHLTLQTNRTEATLQRRATLGWQDSESWVDVCTAPCDQRVERKGVYRVAGSDLRPSELLQLPPSENTTVVATMGSRSAHVGGIACLIAGNILVSSGLLVASVSFLPLHGFPANGEPPRIPDTGVLAAGLITSVVGLALDVIGVPLLLNNRTQAEARPTEPSDSAVADR